MQTAPESSGAGWDSSYEWKIVTLVALGTALVGIDRFMLLPMFPILMHDLDFGYREVGELTGSLGLAYGFASLLGGILSDRVGRRTVVVVAALGFSLLVGLSGLAAGVASLLVIRALMGVADGAYMTAGIVTTLEASKPSRKGANLGIQLMMLPLFGLALSPILVTQLLRIMEWRWVFIVVAPFGLAVTLALFLVMRPSVPRGPTAPAAAERARTRPRDLFSYRNVWVCALLIPCALTSQVAFGALLPSYMVDGLHLPVTQMGFVVSATGFGGAAGNLVLPRLSDRIGRKAVVLITCAGTAAFTAAMMYSPADPVLLFVLLFAKNVFTFPLITMVLGPALTEGLPPLLRASATGLVIFIGEIVGGGLAPVLGGQVAARFGIWHAFDLPILMIVAGFLIGCFLMETAPRVVAARRAGLGEAGPGLAAPDAPAIVRK